MEFFLPDQPEFRWVAFAFVLAAGLCVGSFLNVVIYRLPIGVSLVSPRSACPCCDKLIPWHRNIPILSYFLLRGKCGECSARISLLYPAVEALTALLFLLSAVREPNLLLWPFHFYFLGALIACTFIDLKHWILPDKITLPGIVIGFLSVFARPGTPWLESLTGILFGGGILYAVAWAYRAYAKRDGIGGGDIKFLAMTGAFLGVRGALVTLVLASMLGSVIGVFLIAVRKKSGETAIPFGPFLALGALVAFLFGAPIWEWYFNFH